MLQCSALHVHAAPLPELLLAQLAHVETAIKAMCMSWYMLSLLQLRGHQPVPLTLTVQFDTKQELVNETSCKSLTCAL